MTAPSFKFITAKNGKHRQMLAVFLFAFRKRMLLVHVGSPSNRFSVKSHIRVGI